MRLKSTGLGATELFGDLTSLDAKMSGVLMHVKIKKPVVWRVRTFLQPADLRRIVWRALMPWNAFFVIKTILKGKFSGEKKKTTTVAQAQNETH